MAWLVGILVFIFGAIGVFSTGLFILSCIASIQNPQIVLQDGKAVEQNDNARLVFLLIMSISWAFVMALA